ncbi:hypothetical protein [Ponticaulis profundi]|uniref:Uncharacterized protein n=1 Tax=Ponticaulis profundi TaxID=2665222 RepID=A0ABW1SC19_9PROT
MRDGFNQGAPETYEQRQDRLQRQADAIDRQLNTPQSPQMHLRPKGAMRSDGDRIAREAMENKRVDLMQEIERIKKERSQGQEQTIRKSKSL